MAETKVSRDEAKEAWDQVGKAMQRATELYLEELDLYLGWTRDVRHEVLAETLAMTQRLSQIGEAQLSFMKRLQRSVPFFGVIPPNREGARTMAGEGRPGAA